MIRKQIVIDEERDALVARMAEERGVSQSEIIRLAIDGLAATSASEREAARAHAWLMDFFANAPDLGLTDENGNRTWTREDLYRDRGVR